MDLIPQEYAVTEDVAPITKNAAETHSMEALPEIAQSSDVVIQYTDSKCVECGLSDGELLSCSNCSLVYHKNCLLQFFRLKQENIVWQCPQCQWKLINAGNLPNDMLNINLGYTDESIIDDGNLTNAKQQTEESTSVPSSQQGVTIKGKSRTVNGIVPSSNSSVSVADAATTIKTGISSPTRELLDDKKRKKPATEGSNYATKINVGFSHQVPFTPAFFLDDGFGKPTERYEWARLMYSPYQLERIRVRKLQEGCFDNVIKNEYELAEFIQLCAKNWKNCPGWHPFSPEFAYKILHFADYDPKKALKIMSDPGFNFACVCDPPTRRYDNKWKPKDRRGQAPTSPYPPPVTLRGYLLRRHNTTASSSNL